MLSRAANTFIRKAPTVARTSRIPAPVGSRFVGTLEEIPSAKTAWEKSCYFEMDFTIPEESYVFEAIQKFAAYDIGCLVTTDEDGEFINIVSVDVA